MVRKEAPILFYTSSKGEKFPLRYLILDLDNTLYPSSSGLAEEMNARMTRFVADYLSLPLETALSRRQDGFRRFGTTFRWLQEECGLDDPGLFMNYVHPEDLERFLPAGPELAHFLASLEIPKVILTNAPRAHAERVLRFYGVESLFDHVFDIESNNFVGKPHAEAYRKCLNWINLPPEETLFVDDVADYLETFRSLGGHCILVSEDGSPADNSFDRIASIYGLDTFLS